MGDEWGDAFFAEDFARSLRRLGHTVFVDRLGEHIRPTGARRDDVVVQLRGLHLSPLEPGALNVLWVISHPDLVDDDEIRSGFDLVLAASAPWAEKKTRETGFRVSPLLQATDPGRFHRGPVDSDLRFDLLFLGRSRNVFRTVVKDALEIGAPITIIGENWEQFIDMSHVHSPFLDNERVSAAYRGARVVLNDHWEDMRRAGFISNRLFDAVASGAVVVSDPVEGISDIFSDSVAEYESVEDLKAILSPTYVWPSESERERASLSVAQRHSFDARAEEFVAYVRHSIRHSVKQSAMNALPSFLRLQR
nr:glycosyltransferase [Clavibacter michiganensis]